MQLAAVEFARNKCNLSNAHTTEVNSATQYPIIDILPAQKQVLAEHAYGGTMRLGAYAAQVKRESKVAQLYQSAARMAGTEGIVTERHRHRYEVNPVYVDLLEQKGLSFSGYHERNDGTKLMEFLEFPNIHFLLPHKHIRSLRAGSAIQAHSFQDL